MSDYSKMKNADLEALLKSRNLPHTGKKAEMVDRLVKDDEKKSAGITAPATTSKDEDEIDWEDDDEPTKSAAEPPKPAAETTKFTEAAVTEAEATTIKAGGQGHAANPQAVPNQVADVDPAETNDLSVKPPAEDTEEVVTGEANGASAEKTAEEPPVDFTRGLAATSLDEEIERRKKRAAKFGLNVEDDEGLKILERQKKFGGTEAPRGLDEALPERGRKRGREGNDDSGRNKRRGGRFQGRRGQGRGGDGGPREGGRERRDKPKEKWMGEADKAKAEARKNRFQTAA